MLRVGVEPEMDSSDILKSWPDNEKPFQESRSSSRKEVTAK